MKSITILFLAVIAATVGVHAENIKQSGIVKDAQTRAAIVGARVSAAGGQAAHDAITDGKGTFILPLAAGTQTGDTIRIRVQKDGYATYDEQVPVSAEVPLQIVLTPLNKAHRNAPTGNQSSTGSTNIAVGNDNFQNARTITQTVAPCGVAQIGDKNVATVNCGPPSGKELAEFGAGTVVEILAIRRSQHSPSSSRKNHWLPASGSTSRVMLLRVFTCFKELTSALEHGCLHRPLSKSLSFLLEGSFLR